MRIWKNYGGILFSTIFALALSAHAETPQVQDKLVCYPAGEVDIVFPHLSGPGKIATQGTVTFEQQFPTKITYNNVQLQVDVEHFTNDAPGALNLVAATATFNSSTNLVIDLIQPGAYSFQLTGSLTGVSIPENEHGVNCLYIDGTVGRPAMSGGN